MFGALDKTGTRKEEAPVMHLHLLLSNIGWQMVRRYQRRLACVESFIGGTLIYTWWNSNGQGLETWPSAASQGREAMTEEMKARIELLKVKEKEKLKKKKPKPKPKAKDKDQDSTAELSGSAPSDFTITVTWRANPIGYVLYLIRTWQRQNVYVSNFYAWLVPTFCTVFM